MKTIAQALKDEVYYPINDGMIENIITRRGMTSTENFTTEVANSVAYKGAWADCLISLLQSISFNEADKSIGALTDQQRKSILVQANKLYSSIGEEEVPLEPQPMVYYMN